MVSIRRRRLLGMCSGRNSLLGQLSWANTPQNPSENTQSPSVFPLPLNEDIASKNKPSASSSPLKERHFPEIKRRKQHKRKHVENQEPCIMRGVYYKNLKWQAAIKVDKKQIHLGTVGSQEEAARLYDRAAFMCGREPNFELSEEEKQELRKFEWEEFLAMTRSAITSKKIQRRSGTSRRKLEDGDFMKNSFSGSEDDIHY